MKKPDTSVMHFRYLVLKIALTLGAFSCVILGLGVLLWWIIQPGKDGPSSSPELGFYYEKRIDRYFCPSRSRLQITQNWQTELNERIPELTSIWNDRGTPLLTATAQLLNQQFRHKKYSIPIFLCPAIPGLGLPLIVPANLYLESALGKERWKDEEFIGAVYHELLHLYIAHAHKWNLWTPLLLKYSEEDIYTRIHLHLYALQKVVYLSQNRDHEWESTVLRAKTFPAAYSRAIDIVNVEGSDGFIEELKNK